MASTNISIRSVMGMEEQDSNYILLRLNHPLLIIPSEARQEYISALRMIRTEATDEHLIRFFFKMAIQRMEEELKQKETNTKRFMTFLF